MNNQEKMEKLKVLGESVLKNKEGIDLLMISSIGDAKTAIVEGSGPEIIDSLVSLMQRDDKIAHILLIAADTFKKFYGSPSIAIKKVNHSKDVN